MARQAGRGLEGQAQRAAGTNRCLVLAGLPDGGLDARGPRVQFPAHRIDALAHGGFQLPYGILCRRLVLARLRPHGALDRVLPCAKLVEPFLRRRLVLARLGPHGALDRRLPCAQLVEPFLKPVFLMLLPSL